MADNEDATPRPPAAIPPAAQSNLQPFITQMVDGPLPPRRNPPPEVLGVGSAWVPGPLLSTTTPVSGVVANGGVGSSIAESTGTAANNSGTYRPNGANLEPPPMPTDSKGTAGAAGIATLANRDSIIIQSTAIRLFLDDAICRAKNERSNSANLPELETLRSAVEELHQMLLATSAPAEMTVGEKAISIRDALVNWWNLDHANILNSSFYMGLFCGGLLLCSYFSLASAATVAAIIRGKDFTEAAKAIAKIIKGE